MYDPDFYELYSKERVIHGFAKGRSFITHALRHKEAGSVVVLDLYHAFESTTKEKVLREIEKIGANRETITFLEQNAFVRDFLPAGYPTSPDLFNCALIPMDLKLLRFAKTMGLNYSRYCDDLAFSLTESELFIEQENIDSIREIIKYHGYDSHKIRLGHPFSHPFKICGVSIYQGRITLPDKTLRRIRAVIHKELFKKDESNKDKVISLLSHVKAVRGNLPNSLKRYENALTWRTSRY